MKQGGYIVAKFLCSVFLGICLVGLLIGLDYICQTVLTPAQQQMHIQYITHSIAL